MRKYWKFTAIFAVIVLSIGTFYVNSARSAEQYPEFEIQTVSGDAKEVKPVVLEGAYTNTSSMNYVSTNVKISAKGSAYNSRSFLDQIVGQSPTLIKEFQKKYHTFMRGKNSMVNSFFEDQQFLVYADVENKVSSLLSHDFTFQLSVLNKEDDSISSFKVKVPEAGELDHIFVEDVQLMGDEIILITQNTMRENDTFYDEKHIYTIERGNHKITSHEAIIQVPQGQLDTRIDVELVRTSPAKANDHLIMVKTERKVMEDPEGDAMTEEVIHQEILSYDLQTKEKETINLPDLQLDENQLSFYDGAVIYFMTIEGQELVVTPYSLADNQAGQVYRIPLSGEEGIAHGQMTTVKGGKLYVASSQMSPGLKIDADVIVADAQTGKTLFKGKLAVKDASEQPENFEVYLNEIVVK